MEAYKIAIKTLKVIDSIDEALPKICTTEFEAYVYHKILTIDSNKEEKTHVRSMWPGWDWKTYTVEDLAIGQIRFANGAIMQIEAAFAAHIKENEIHEFSAMGTKGGCEFPSGTIFTDQNNTMVNVTPAWTDSKGEEWTVLFTKKLQNWVNGCLKGTELDASGEDGLNVQRILNAVYDSAAAGGKEVAIK